MPAITLRDSRFETGSSTDWMVYFTEQGSQVSDINIIRNGGADAYFTATDVEFQYTSIKESREIGPKGLFIDERAVVVRRPYEISLTYLEDDMDTVRLFVKNWHFENPDLLIGRSVDNNVLAKRIIIEHYNKQNEKIDEERYLVTLAEDTLDYLGNQEYSLDTNTLKLTVVGTA